MPKFKNGIRIGVIKGAITFIIILIVLSVLALYIDLPNSIIGFLSYMIISLVSFQAAYESTQKFRSKGIIQGLCCGLLIFSILFLISIIVNGFLISERIIIKSAICLMFGTLGGIIGINSKKTKL